MVLCDIYKFTNIIKYILWYYVIFTNENIQKLITVKHSVEVGTDRGENHFMSGYRHHPGLELHITQLVVDPHAVHGREPGDSVALWIFIFYEILWVMRGLVLGKIWVFLG